MAGVFVSRRLPPAEGPSPALVAPSPLRAAHAGGEGSIQTSPDWTRGRGRLHPDVPSLALQSPIGSPMGEELRVTHRHLRSCVLKEAPSNRRVNARCGGAMGCPELSGLTAGCLDLQAAGSGGRSLLHPRPFANSGETEPPL